MNLNAERAVIGIILMDNKAIEKVYTRLRPEMFSNSLLGRIYQEIKLGYDRGYSLDIAILESKMAGDDVSKELFYGELQEIIQYSPLSYEIKTYAKIIENEYKAKQAAKLISEIKLKPDTINEQLAELQRTIETLSSESSQETQNIAEIVDEYSPRKFTDNNIEGIKLGIRKLDEYVDLDPGDICIIAARPSVGKSAIAKQIAFNLARAGHRVEMFMLEMTKEQTYDRIAAAESGIELARLRRGKAFVGEEKGKFDKANAKLRALGDKLLINDNMYKVSEMAMDMKRNKVDVGIIDYAQLIKPESNYRGNRYAEVGAISHAVKETAKKLQIPIILLAQLNRTSEKTENKEPTMGELRESGDFEQDASVIILLWNKNEDRTLKGVKVDKNRHNKTCKFELVFKGDTMTFSESGEPDITDDEEDFRSDINYETPFSTG